MDVPPVAVPEVLSRADARDQRAERRDRAADERDQVAAASPDDTTAAARHRARAHVDRLHAGEDRDAAAEDRADLIDCLTSDQSLERPAGLAELSGSMVEPSRGGLTSSGGLLDEDEDRLHTPSGDAVPR